MPCRVLLQHVNLLYTLSAELPATIKLITGIIARVQANCETSDSQVAGLPHCCCELCKTLLLFLQAPAQHAMDTEVSGPEFPHMCR